MTGGDLDNNWTLIYIVQIIYSMVLSTVFMILIIPSILIANDMQDLIDQTIIIINHLHAACILPALYIYIFMPCILMQLCTYACMYVHM